MDEHGRAFRRDISIPQRCAPRLSVRQVRKIFTDHMNLQYRHLSSPKTYCIFSSILQFFLIKKLSQGKLISHIGSEKKKEGVSSEMLK